MIAVMITKASSSINISCLYSSDNFRFKVRHIVKSQAFYWLIIGLVFLNTVFVAVEHHGQDEFLTKFLCELDSTFSSVLTIIHSFIHSFMHSFIAGIYIALLPGGLLRGDEKAKCCFRICTGYDISQPQHDQKNHLKFIEECMRKGTMESS